MNFTTQKNIITEKAHLIKKRVYVMTSKSKIFYDKIKML